MTTTTSRGLLLFVVAVVAMFCVSAAQSPCPAPSTCQSDTCVGMRCPYNEFTYCEMDCNTCKPKFFDLEKKEEKCDKLTLKCRLMHLEMVKKKKGSRSGGAPDGGRQDTDELYDPDCDAQQQFRAKQCDNGTGECWCVNSAGVRNTDKSKSGVDCPKLVLCSQIVLDFFLPMDHKPSEDEKIQNVQKVKDILGKNYFVIPDQFKNVQLLDTRNMIVTLTQNVSGNVADIATVAYLADKQLKAGKLQTSETPPQTIEVDPDARKPIVWFYDDEPPRMSPSRMAPGIIAIIVIAVLAAVTAAVIFFWWKKQQGTKKYNRAHKQELQDAA
ncbi:epithelial cell adhesion molecule-like isoform X2 [Petromyzon marinus]|uniref:Epithelial cell adhesion molecule-like isoform X2 n=1 Tax=Petromyzon marinus TaxID=7757 RepID=A0AAJ7TL88_PETMA|nr:epithelial cell adhesion molecule-like isoform X2 [Petromyzon marinus]